MSSKNEKSKHVLDPPGLTERRQDDLDLDVSGEEESDSGISPSSLHRLSPDYKDQVLSITEVPFCNIQPTERATETEEQHDQHDGEEIQIYESSLTTNNGNEGDTIFVPDYKDQVRSVANIGANSQEQAAVSHAAHKKRSQESDDTPLVQAVAVGMTLATESSNTSTRRSSWRKQRNYLIIIAALAMVFAAVLLTVLLIFLKSDGESNMVETEQVPTESSDIIRTESPTMLPTISERAASIVSYIRNITLSNNIISYPPVADATPIELAVEWLIDSDPLQLSVETSIERFRLQQRYALLTLWFQTNGNSWHSKAGWLQFEDECTWYGIACKESNSTVKEVSEVDLDRDFSVNGNNLQNKIPDDLFLLTALTFLDLSRNSITGPIPNSIGKLTRLDRLRLALMDLTGTIPSSLGNLENLKEFHIFSNLLTSTLPSSIGRMTSITVFDASQNSLQGSIPSSIVNWVAIKKFYLYANTMLGGQIPEELWSLTTLTDLSLRGLSLTSTISSSIGTLSNLKYFRIHQNQLTSTLPSALGLLTGMKEFSVSRNNLEGTIPESLSNWTNIEEVYLYGNNFTGTVPIGLCLYLPENLEADCNAKVECICCTSCRD